MFHSAFLIGANKGVFDWDQTDTLRSVARIQNPILLIHGGADTWLSPDHSRRLLSEAKLGSRLIVVPDETHVSLPLGTDKIAGDVRSWFDSELLTTATDETETSPAKTITSPKATPTL
jgi:pimeloyl-ACP methyl ester carboxylesterase